MKAAGNAALVAALLSPDGSIAILRKFRAGQGPPGALTRRGGFAGTTGPENFNAHGTVFRIKE